MGKEQEDFDEEQIYDFLAKLEEDMYKEKVEKAKKRAEELKERKEVIGKRNKQHESFIASGSEPPGLDKTEGSKTGMVTDHHKSTSKHQMDVVREIQNQNKERR